MIALVLAATGFFVYVQFQHEGKTAVDAGLRSRANELAAVVRREESNLAAGEQHLVGRTDSFAEVLDPDGRVLDSSPMIGGTDLLDPQELREATAAPVFVDRGPLPGLDEGSRLLAAPVDASAGDRIVVVGASTQDTNEANTDLKQLLLIGLPGALLLA